MQGRRRGEIEAERRYPHRVSGDGRVQSATERKARTKADELEPRQATLKMGEGEERRTKHMWRIERVYDTRASGR